MESSSFLGDTSKKIPTVIIAVIVLAVAFAALKKFPGVGLGSFLGGAKDLPYDDIKKGPNQEKGKKIIMDMKEGKGEDTGEGDHRNTKTIKGKYLNEYTGELRCFFTDLIYIIIHVRYNRISSQLYFNANYKLFIF